MSKLIEKSTLKRLITLNFLVFKYIMPITYWIGVLIITTISIFIICNFFPTQKECWLATVVITVFCHLVWRIVCELARIAVGVYDQHRKFWDFPNSQTTVSINKQWEKYWKLK